MEGSVGFLDRLSEALVTRAKWLETMQITKLRDAMISYQSLFEGVMAMLIRKGLLREDPYNYEQAFTEIVLPSDETLPEFENSDELSFRLAAFRRQLRYVSTEYPMQLSDLGLARLKRVTSLVAYVNWLEFGEGSKSPTTKAFARAFMKVRMGSDTMASQILKDSETQIVRTMQGIRALIAELVAYQREVWKAELRAKVLPSLGLVSGETRMQREEAQRAVRRGFAHSMADKPWYPALADEVIDEEIADDGEKRRDKVLTSLVVTATVKEKPSNAPEGRTILKDAVRMLGRPHEELATALAILEENERVLLEGRPTGGGWLKRILGVGGPTQAPDRQYKVQFAEPGTATPKTETVDFPKLLEEVEKKSSFLATLTSGSSPASRKVAKASEKQLAAFLDRQLNDLLLIHRRLTSLNTSFQARMAQEKKSARGIKIELLTIKNAIIKANEKRHEYTNGAEGH